MRDSGVVWAAPQGILLTALPCYRHEKLMNHSHKQQILKKSLIAHAQGMFRPMSGLISCTGVTGRGCTTSQMHEILVSGLIDVS